MWLRNKLSIDFYRQRDREMIQGFQGLVNDLYHVEGHCARTCLDCMNIVHYIYVCIYIYISRYISIFDVYIYICNDDVVDYNQEIYLYIYYIYLYVCVYIPGCYAWLHHSIHYHGSMIIISGIIELGTLIRLKAQQLLPLYHEHYNYCLLTPLPVMEYL